MRQAGGSSAVCYYTSVISQQSVSRKAVVLSACGVDQEEKS